MREIFVPDGSFTGSNVQLAVKGVIRGVLVSLFILHNPLLRNRDAISHC